MERESELFRLLVDNIADGAIFVVDPLGRVQTWNVAAERLLGYQEAEIIGQSAEIFFTAEDVKRGIPQHQMQVSLAGGKANDDRWQIRKDGSRFWAGGLMTALQSQDGQPRGFAIIMRDRTEWKMCQEQLRFKDQLLDIVDEAVIATAPDGRIFYWNQFAEKLYGRSRGEAIGRNLREIVATVETVADGRDILDQPRAGKSWTGEFPVRRPDGSVFLARLSNTPIFDGDGTIQAIVGVSLDVSQQQRTQSDLRQSEQWVRALMEQAPFSIQVFTADGRTVQVNSAWEKLWGVRFDQIADYNILQDGQLEAKGILPYIRRAFAGESVEIPAIQYDRDVTLPGRNRRPDPIRWVSAVAYPLKDDAGHVRKVILIHQDMTASKQAEQQWRSLADAMPQIVWTATPDGAIDYQNQKWQEFTGLPATIGNEGWQQIMHPDDAPRANARGAASIESGDPFEIEIRLYDRRTQSYRWHLLRAVAGRDAEGNVVRWYGAATDIDQQKRAEQSSRYLAEASVALARIVDYESTLQKVANLAVPYFADWSAVDVAGSDGALRRLAVAHCNPEKIRLAHQLMHDYPSNPQAIAGATAVFRTGKPELCTEITDELLVRSAKDERHLRLLRALGLRSYICVPLAIAGSTIGVLSFGMAESGRLYTVPDLALAIELAHRAAVAIENNRLYQALRDSDRRKDEFLATLAHELRNPLAPLRNSLQVLKMPRIDNETLERSREIMDRQVHHLVRLVDDLLDVSRVMRGKIDLRREPVELATVIGRAIETVQPLIDAQEHELSVDLPRESLPLDADSVRLAQVFGNLLANAAKYTERSGRIWLSASREGQEAVVRIRDNGIGIEAEILPRIFGLFVQVDHAATRSQGGLGIGLTLVKNLVEMHRGTVAAHSEGLGTGTEFTVHLPLVDKRNQPAEETSADQTAAHSGRRLMVVDDNQDAADSLAMLLALQGHDVRVANSGPAARALLNDYRPDVVLLDIGMPGMDGFEVARRIRSMPELKNVVLAALTGWGQEEDRRRTAQAGFDHHLVKPVDQKSLQQLLAELNRPTS